MMPAQRAVTLGAAMTAVAILASFFAPPLRLERYHPQLEELIPRQFGDWSAVPDAGSFVNPALEGEATADAGRLYDEVLMRSYRNSHGQVMQLALAYGRNQRQEFKIHRPELCYTAQGYQVVSNFPVDLALTDSNGNAIHGGRMTVTSDGRIQHVSYWIRIGTLFSVNPWAIRGKIFREGLSGRVVDGILVRASEVGRDADPKESSGQSTEEKFLAELVASAPEGARELLIL